MSDGLFEIEPTPISPGDRVRVQTIYGNELGIVEQVFADAEGYPMVTVRTRSGDKISLGIARAERLENFGPTSVVPDE